MTDITEVTPPTDEQVAARDDALRAALRAIADELAAIEVRRRELYAARLGIWKQATLHGWPQARIAEASRCTTNAVTQALHRARRGRKDT